MTRPATIRLLAAVASLLLVSALIVRTTDAAFTATTDNTGNSFAAGSVSIIDYDDGPMFDLTADGTGFTVNASGLVPGNTVSNCIRVEYTGDVDATVDFGVSTVSGGLPAFLNVVVEEFDGADCTGTTATVANNTLANLAGTTKATSWTPLTTTDRWFQVSISVADDDAAQGQSATGVDFTWTASS